MDSSVLICTLLDILQHIFILFSMLHRAYKRNATILDRNPATMQARNPACKQAPATFIKVTAVGEKDILHNLRSTDLD